MQLSIFDSRHKESLDRKFICRLVKKILKKEKYELRKLNIIITDNAYMKELNHTFLKKNHTTNVISFKMDEVSEIYVSYEKMKNPEELYYFMVHGLLHIIGYDHRTKRTAKVIEKNPSST